MSNIFKSICCLHLYLFLEIKKLFFCFTSGQKHGLPSRRSFSRDSSPGGEQDGLGPILDPILLRAEHGGRPRAADQRLGPSEARNVWVHQENFRIGKNNSGRPVLWATWEDQQQNFWSLILIFILLSVFEIFFWQIFFSGKFDFYNKKMFVSVVCFPMFNDPIQK